MFSLFFIPVLETAFENKLIHCIIVWKDLVEISKNLATYRNENNFGELSEELCKENMMKNAVKNFNKLF